MAFDSPGTVTGTETGSETESESEAEAELSRARICRCLPALFADAASCRWLLPLNLLL